MNKKIVDLSELEQEAEYGSDNHGVPYSFDKEKYLEELEDKDNSDSKSK